MVYSCATDVRQPDFDAPAMSGNIGMKQIKVQFAAAKADDFQTQLFV